MKGLKRPKQKKISVAPTSSPKKPTKPDLKNIVKPQKFNNPKSSEESVQKTKNFSKIALDSLLSRNKNSQFAPGKFPDSSDYLERLNDNHQSESDDDEYDDEEDEGSIHPISSGTDPNVLLHALTNSQKHQTYSDEVSHFSNSHINPVTRKNPQVEDSKHPSVPLPGPPTAVQAVIVKPRFVTLNWLEPVENPDEVVSYTVYYKMNSNDARYGEYLNFIQMTSKLRHEIFIPESGKLAQIHATSRKLTFNRCCQERIIISVWFPTAITVKVNPRKSSKLRHNLKRTLRAHLKAFKSLPFPITRFT